MILVAPTSFKATIGAAQAAAAIAAGVRAALPGAEVVELPLSDGGPGLLDALDSGELATVTVAGPLGQPVAARLLLRQGGAVMESADACGLHLLAPHERDPLRTHTRGVGELLLAAAARGAREIACGLGGSATVDGGAGMAQALGYRLLDGAGRALPGGGGALERLRRIVPPAAPAPLPSLIGLADVRSPLLGAEGAAAVFGPQKGADAAGVARLDAGLRRLAEVVARDLGLDMASPHGAGAAGGLGAGLVAFAGGRLQSGSEWVLRAVGFEGALARARLLVTGEGAYDEQSALGKITGAVVRRARERGLPVLLLCGAVRAPLPPGVTGVDGQGRLLTPAALGALAEAWVPRLLGA